LQAKNLSTHADIFAENDRHEEAAWLYFEAGEHEKDSELKRAAYRKAAREYCEVGNHVKVLAACYHGGLYKQLIDNLNGWAAFLLRLKKTCQLKLSVIRKSTRTTGNSMHGYVI